MAVYKRKYSSYKQYIRHQARKAKKLKKRKAKFKANVRSFCRRFGEFIQYFSGKKVLCLGARFGEEVLALKKMGYPNTIGIDLEPGHPKYVIKGDFHNIPFEDGSFDSVYINCIDHAWDIQSLFIEAGRVLKRDGVFILEIQHIIGVNRKQRRELIGSGSKYESVVFDRVSDISKMATGFKLIKEFKSKYRKIVVVFQKIYVPDWGI